MPLKITKPYFTCLEMTHTELYQKELGFSRRPVSNFQLNG